MKFKEIKVCASKLNGCTTAFARSKVLNRSKKGGELDNSEVDEMIEGKMLIVEEVKCESKDHVLEKDEIRSKTDSGESAMCKRRENAFVNLDLVFWEGNDSEDVQVEEEEMKRVKRLHFEEFFVMETVKESREKNRKTRDKRKAIRKYLEKTRRERKIWRNRKFRKVLKLWKLHKFWKKGSNETCGEKADWRQCEILTFCESWRILKFRKFRKFRKFQRFIRFEKWRKLLKTWEFKTSMKSLNLGSVRNVLNGRTFGRIVDIAGNWKIRPFWKFARSKKYWKFKKSKNLNAVKMRNSITADKNGKLQAPEKLEKSKFEGNQKFTIQWTFGKF